MTNLPNVNIENSLFHDIRKQGCGGVFELNSVNINISTSIFSVISSSSYGGCLYATASFLNLKNSLFDECRITKSQNELLGNALYVNNENQNTESSIITIIDQISHSKCGRELSDGDSSICLNSLMYKATNVNSTFNTGTRGSSLFTGYHNCEGSSVSYSQDSQSTALTSIVSGYQQLECSNCNFINTKELQDCILWSDPDNMLIIKSCIFYNSHNKLYQKKCIITGCKSDLPFPEIEERISSSDILYSIKAFKLDNKKASAFFNHDYQYLPIYIWTFIFIAK